MEFFKKIRNKKNNKEEEIKIVNLGNEESESIKFNNEETESVDIKIIKEHNIQYIKGIFENIIHKYIKFPDEISSDILTLKNDYGSIIVNISEYHVLCKIHSNNPPKEYNVYILGNKGVFSSCEEFYLDENDEILNCISENFSLIIENIIEKNIKKIRKVKEQYASLIDLKEDYTSNKTKYSDLIKNFNQSIINSQIAKNRYDEVKKQNLKLIETILFKFSNIFNDEYVRSENLEFHDKKVEVIFNTLGEEGTCLIVFGDGDYDYCCYLFDIMPKDNYCTGGCCFHKTISEIEDEKLNFIVKNLKFFTNSLLKEAKKIDDNFDEIGFIKSILD